MNRLTALALILSLASPSAVLADKPRKQGKWDEARVVVTFTDDDRAAARDRRTRALGRKTSGQDRRPRPGR
jgi:hypothetical protein